MKKKLLIILMLFLSLTFSIFAFPAKEARVFGINDLSHFMKSYDFESQKYDKDISLEFIMRTIQEQKNYNFCWTKDGKFAFFGIWTQYGPIGYVIDFRDSFIQKNEEIEVDTVE
jgi:hypothetical protein